MNKNKKRSLSRLMAIQIFYQQDFLPEQKSLSEISHDVIENYALSFDEEVSSYRAKIDEEFLNNLISGLTLDVKKIDEAIAEFLQGSWSLDKLDNVMLQILRLGAFELKFMQDIPTNVVIDEYVDIAASFFDEKKTTFANALLDKLAKKFREEKKN